MSFGVSIPRLEDARFLSGRACFVDDLKFPGMLHAVVVRSSHAHAQIKNINFERHKGAHAVFTYADIARYDCAIPIRLGPLPGFERFLQKPLAADTVRFVGEPVALVVAENRYLAEDAAEAVQVDYEPLAPVVRAEEGMADRSVIHRGAGTNVGTRYTVGSGDVAGALAR